MTTRVPSDDNNTSSNDNNNGCIYFLNKEQGKLSTAANCEVPQGLFIFIILFFEAQKKTKQLQIQRKGNEKKPNNEISKSKTNTWM